MADFAEADQRQLLALEVIDVPQEGSKHVGPQVANLPWAARWIFGLYRPRDRRCDFFQRSHDHRRIAKQSQTVFKCQTLLRPRERTVRGSCRPPPKITPASAAKPYLG